MKVLFLLSLATAQRIGELQAISFRVAFQGDLSLFFLPEFVANPIRHWLDPGHAVLVLWLSFHPSRHVLCLFLVLPRRS